MGIMLGEQMLIHLLETFWAGKRSVSPIKLATDSDSILAVLDTGQTAT